jgi:hypothetical protein
MKFCMVLSFWLGILPRVADHPTPIGYAKSSPGFPGPAWMRSSLRLCFWASLRPVALRRVLLRTRGARGTTAEPSRA